MTSFWMAEMKEDIGDNYEKVVLSLNKGMDDSYEGIKSLSLVDWLLS